MAIAPFATPIALPDCCMKNGRIAIRPYGQKKASLRAERSNPAVFSGLLRRYAPRNDVEKIGVIASEAKQSKVVQGFPDLSGHLPARLNNFQYFRAVSFQLVLADSCDLAQIVHCPWADGSNVAQGNVEEDGVSRHIACQGCVGAPSA